ncbi:DUF4272 domain-containing protein [Pseudaeromonas paramecii]|uniref:DUF4272 domain-containing protein n=1 Tax=Pseudaeromonas paramecii TaxID=2138166 RepID=A0ABP8QDL9_9GAMM
MEDLKTNTTNYLASVGIEVPSQLPVIEGLDEVVPKSATDVAGRLCALAYVIGLGFGAKGSDLCALLQKFDLMQFVSEHEKKLLGAVVLGDQDKEDMFWQKECAQALAWCIGLVELDHFKHCDDDLAHKIPFKIDPNNFIRSAILRPIYEIQEQSDLLYRMHWYTKNCRLIGQHCDLSESIISKRRKAIDWAYGVEENWDEVPMDT